MAAEDATSYSLAAPSDDLRSQLALLGHLADPSLAALVSSRQWHVLLHLALDLLGAPDLSVSSTMLAILSRFLAAPEADGSHAPLVSSVLLPRLFEGLHAQEFNYRRCCVTLLAHVALHCPILLPELVPFLKHPPRPSKEVLEVDPTAMPVPTVKNSLLEQLVSHQSEMRSEALRKVARRIGNHEE